MCRIPCAHLIAIRGFEEDTADSKDAPACSILTGGFDFSGCGDWASCPVFEPAEMSNSEPSAIMLQGIFACVDYTNFANLTADKHG